MPRSVSGAALGKGRLAGATSGWATRQAGRLAQRGLLAWDEGVALGRGGRGWTRSGNRVTSFEARRVHGLHWTSFRIRWWQFPWAFLNSFIL